MTTKPAKLRLFYPGADNGVQTWTYNSLLQATAVTGTGMSMTYNFSPNKNNGQITSSVDAGVTPNETITYTYDALKRLLEADGLNWKEKYVYDGFGNLTQMNPTGAAPTLSVSVLMPKAEKKSLAWSRFKRLAKLVGLPAGLSKNTTRQLTDKTSDDLNHYWDQVRGE